MRIVNQKRKRINLWLQHSEELKEKLGQIGLTTAAQYEHWVKDFYGSLCNGLPFECLEQHISTRALQNISLSLQPTSTTHPNWMPWATHRFYTCSRLYWKMWRLYCSLCFRNLSLQTSHTVCTVPRINKLAMLYHKGAFSTSLVRKSTILLILIAKRCQVCFLNAQSSYVIGKEIRYLHSTPQKIYGYQAR